MTLLRSVLYTILFVLWTLGFGLICLPLLLLPREWTCRGGRLWLRGCFWLLRWVCGLRFEVRGEIPPNPVLIACKHQATMETLAFRLIYSDPAIILKQELLRIPLFGWYLNKSGVIAIDRSAGAKALKQMVRGAEQARDESRSVLIFPEGTRSEVGAPPEYQPGIALLYSSLGLPCVPVALNTGVFWPRGGLTKHSGTAVIEFLPVIAPGLDRKAFLAELENRIETASARLAQEARTP